VQGRYAQLLLPESDPDHLSVEDLDIDELAKGRLKDKNGKFSGRPPKFLPRQIVDAMKKEYYQRVNAVLEESLSDMVKTMRAIALDAKADDAVRLKAAIYVYERFMGKVPDRIQHTAESKVDDIVDDILYDVNEKQQTEIEKELAAAEEELRDTPARRRRTPAQRMRQRHSD
jgi:tRNA threonylcarbamoyladenosine modification (KEOPS) complex  Pcc1 subunit